MRKTSFRMKKKNRKIILSLLGEKKGWKIERQIVQWQGTGCLLNRKIRLYSFIIAKENKVESKCTQNVIKKKLPTRRNRRLALLSGETL